MGRARRRPGRSSAQPAAGRAAGPRRCHAGRPGTGHRSPPRFPRPVASAPAWPAPVWPAQVAPVRGPRSPVVPVLRVRCRRGPADPCRRERLVGAAAGGRRRRPARFAAGHRPGYRRPRRSNSGRPTDRPGPARGTPARSVVRRRWGVDRDPQRRTADRAPPGAPGPPDGRWSHRRPGPGPPGWPAGPASRPACRTARRPGHRPGTAHRRAAPSRPDPYRRPHARRPAARWSTARWSTAWWPAPRWPARWRSRLRCSAGRPGTPCRWPRPSIRCRRSCLRPAASGRCSGFRRAPTRRSPGSGWAQSRRRPGSRRAPAGRGVDPRPAGSAGGPRRRCSAGRSRRRCSAGRSRRRCSAGRPRRR